MDDGDFIQRSDYMSISISSLLGTSSSSSSSYFDVSSLGDYEMIRNGSYYKLMKNYYANESSSSSSSSSTTSTDQTNALSRLYTDSSKLKNSISALSKSSLYEKVSKTDENGNTTQGYDVDAIYKAVSSFVDNYNSVIEEGDNVTDDDTTDNIVNMIKNTSTNSSLLAKIGITIGDDYQLTLDEETFKAADMNTVKTLFNGQGTYGSIISSEASSTMSDALKATNTTSTYTSSGVSYISASAALGSLFDTSS